MKPEFEPSGSTALCLSPGFVALGEFSFPGWDAGLWQGYPLPTSNSLAPISIPGLGERHWRVKCVA